jgi:glycosyltransferase involved in cell wall biosynthesis
MKIGYWLEAVSLNCGGTSPYSIRVLDCLLEAAKINSIHLTIFIFAESASESIEICNSLADKYKTSAIIKVIDNNISSFDKALNFFEYIIKSLYLKLKKEPPNFVNYLNFWYRLLSLYRVDLIHFPRQIPINFNLPYPYLVTMHDVQELHYPEFFSPQERAFRAQSYWQSLEKSKAVIVSFEHVKKDLIKYFRLKQDKIYLCPLAYDKIDLLKPDEREDTCYQSKYKSCHQYILYPAQTWPHKNHISLIKALEFLYEKYNFQVSLVCTGKKNEFYNSYLSNYIKESKLAANIYFTGIVPEQELCWLYLNCELVVIPTLYEAGSFPLLEAMSLGIPVICSSVTSLPETLGDFRFIFDPLDIQNLADLILRMITDKSFCKSNQDSTSMQIDKLRLNNPSNQFIKAYKYALKSSDDS